MDGGQGVAHAVGPDCRWPRVKKGLGISKARSWRVCIAHGGMTMDAKLIPGQLSPALSPAQLPGHHGPLRLAAPRPHPVMLLRRAAGHGLSLLNLEPGSPLLSCVSGVLHPGDGKADTGRKEETPRAWAGCVGLTRSKLLCVRRRSRERMSTKVLESWLKNFKFDEI